MAGGLVYDRVHRAEADPVLSVSEYSRELGGRDRREALSRFRLSILPEKLQPPDTPRASVNRSGELAKNKGDFCIACPPFAKVSRKCPAVPTGFVE